MHPFEAVRQACEQYRAGGLSLPDVLRVCEHARQTDPPPERASVLIATLEGDVHFIGKALLGALLRTCGYRVVDLGRDVPVEEVVRATAEGHVDAVALSALLVTSSRKIPACVQALDTAGIHLPVLIGGAAMNRAFGRRAGILADGRIYEPGVFYCRDVFEGLRTLDALFDGRGAEAPAAAAAGETIVSRSAAPTTRARTSPPRIEPPQPRSFGAQRLPASLEAVWRHLDLNTLFRHHWGGFPLRDAEYERLVGEVFQPELARLQADAVRHGWLEPLIVSGAFACRSEGDALLVDGVRFDFPRQAEGEQLCLADYFSPEQDVVVLQAVSTGQHPLSYLEQLEGAGEYVRMLYVNGLSAATAEAMADFAHAHARRELGLPPERGLRFSWGYAACPDLSQQRQLLRLLDADASIGLRLTDSDTLDPEHSTAAMVVHHPEVKYFSVARAA